MVIYPFPSKLSLSTSRKLCSGHLHDFTHLLGGGPSWLTYHTYLQNIHRNPRYTIHICTSLVPLHFVFHKQIPLSGHRQELPGRGFPVEGKPEERGSLHIDFEVDFPSRLRKAHLAALRAVLTEEEIAILEDVLKLMSARKVCDRLTTPQQQVVGRIVRAHRFKVRVWG